MNGVDTAEASIDGPDLVNLPIRPSASGPSPIPTPTFGSMKAIIEDLYMTQNTNLKEVVAIMPRQHGFQAT
jgi:hypothetical protein